MKIAITTKYTVANKEYETSTEYEFETSEELKSAFLLHLENEGAVERYVEKDVAKAIEEKLI